MIIKDLPSNRSLEVRKASHWHFIFSNSGAIPKGIPQKFENDPREIEQLKRNPNLTWIDLHEEVLQGALIGRGASAEVRRGTYQGVPVAVKVPFHPFSFFFPFPLLD